MFLFLNLFFFLLRKLNFRFFFQNDSDYYINKESIIQTYRDFLDYKKNSRIQSRLKDFEALGLSVTKKTSQENVKNI